MLIVVMAFALILCRCACHSTCGRIAQSTVNVNAKQNGLFNIHHCMHVWRRKKTWKMRNTKQKSACKFFLYRVHSSTSFGNRWCILEHAAIKYAYGSLFVRGLPRLLFGRNCQWIYAQFNIQSTCKISITIRCT